MVRSIPLLLLMFGLTGCGESTPTQQHDAALLNSLPQGGRGYVDLGGVRGEIGLLIIADSSSVAKRVPNGLSVYRLRDFADDSAVADHLRSHPEDSSALPTWLSFAALDSVQLLGERAKPIRLRLAFWWAWLRSDSTFERRAKGEQWNLELAAWTDSSSADYAEFVRRAGGTIELGKVVVDGTPPNRWEMTLEVENLRFAGSCMLVGEAQPANYELPAYNTTWPGTAEPASFMVYTFRDHVVRGCSTTWTITGTHELADAVRQTEASSALLGGHVFQQGWRAVGGIFSR